MFCKFSPVGMVLIKSLRLSQIECLWSSGSMLLWQRPQCNHPTPRADSKRRVKVNCWVLQGFSKKRERIPSLDSMAWWQRSSVGTNGCHVSRCSQAFYEPSWTLTRFLPHSDASITLYGSDCNNVRNKHFSSFPSCFGVLVCMHLKDGVRHYCCGTDVFWSFDYFQKELISSFVSSFYSH